MATVVGYGARRATRDLAGALFAKFCALPGSPAIHIEARPIENVARLAFGDPLLDPFDFGDRRVDCLAGALGARFDRGEGCLQLRPSLRFVVALRIDACQFEAQPLGKTIELGKLATPFVEISPARLKKCVQSCTLTVQV